ncbi:MAG TPA: hypothetical protein VNW92_14645 [Polyangiaceae bacterium]|nr:hypothetical protein [Polyangiaceae bacterium]
MRERYRLVGLQNSELLAGLSDLVRRGNELTGDVLAHLAELDERKQPPASLPRPQRVARSGLLRCSAHCGQDRG